MQREGEAMGAANTVSAQRLIRWFDDARNRREAARQTGTGRQVIAEITADLHRDILAGPDRHLIHRIPIPGQESGEEMVYVFPDHRAIYEIKIPPPFLRPMTHFIVFIECDRNSAEAGPEFREAAEAKREAILRRIDERAVPGQGD